MKILTISDTHTKHNQIPLEWLEPADMIIHAGDISSMGSLREIENFCNWFDRLDQYDHKIFIAGNHDWGFQERPTEAMEIVNSYKTIKYLKDSSIVCDGVKIYGSPWQPEFFNWAFNLKRGAKLQEKWDLIPLDTDILITHGPAYGRYEIQDYSRRRRSDSRGERNRRDFHDEVLEALLVRVLPAQRGAAGRCSDGADCFS